MTWECCVVNECAANYQSVINIHQSCVNISWMTVPPSYRCWTTVVLVWKRLSHNARKPEFALSAKTTKFKIWKSDFNYEYMFVYLFMYRLSPFKYIIKVYVYTCVCFYQLSMIHLSVLLVTVLMLIYLTQFILNLIEEMFINIMQL